MLSVLSVALLILLYLSTQQVYAAANFTSSSTGQNVKLLIEQAISALNSGDPKAALSNLTLANKILG